MFTLDAVAAQFGPLVDGVEDGGAAVDGREFTSAGCDASPLFGVAEGAFDDVAAAVVLAVEAGWPARGSAAPGSVADLVPGLRDHGLDAAPAERFPDRPGRVRLVAAEAIWASPRSAGPEPGDGQVRKRRGDHRRVTALPGSDDGNPRTPGLTPTGLADSAPGAATPG